MWWEEGPEPSVSHQQLLKWAESGSFQDFFGALQKEDDHVLSIRSQSGKTLLHLAAWGEGKGHDECVKALIERGADLNVRDDEGWAPIHMAAGIGSVNVVRMLIMHNANVDVPTFKGESALDRAILKVSCCCCCGGGVCVFVVCVVLKKKNRLFPPPEALRHYQVSPLSRSKVEAGVCCKTFQGLPCLCDENLQLQACKRGTDWFAQTSQESPSCFATKGDYCNHCATRL